MASASAMLSKPSLESSAGSSVEASISSASRSRMALAYSVRFRRCSPVVPGLGLAAAARSSAVSSLVRRNASSVGAVGARHTGRRHHPGANLAHHLFPSSPHLLPGCARSSLSIARPPVASLLVVATDAIAIQQRADPARGAEREPTPRTSPNASSLSSLRHQLLNQRHGARLFLRADWWPGTRLRPTPAACGLVYP